MRIAMVTAAYLDVGVGGLESHVYEVSRQLRLRGHDPIVFRTGSGAARLRPPADVPLVVLRPGRLPSPYRRSPATEIARRILNGFQAVGQADRVVETAPDVVHFHDLCEALPMALWLRRRLPAAQVWTNHLGEFLALARYPAGRTVTRLLTAPYRLGIGPSSELARQDACRPPMRFISNGYDPARFYPVSPECRASLRAGFGLDPDQFVVLVPRRWAPTKGVLHFAHAVRRWVPSGRTATVLFAGSGTDRYAAYQEEVRRALAGAAVEVRTLGAVATADMPVLYQVTDLTVVPSLKEATSLSAIESLGCGVPVLGTRVGGLLDLGDACGDCLTLVRPGDPDALLGGLSTFFRPEYRWDGGRAAQIAAEIEKRFSWASVAESVERVYLEAMA
ncbi:glycosyltransferase family 4 protein [Streptomyces sp. NPDC054794]